MQHLLPKDLTPVLEKHHSCCKRYGRYVKTQEDLLRIHHVNLPPTSECWCSSLVKWIACEAHGCEIHLGNYDLIITWKRAFQCFSAFQGNSNSRLNNVYHISTCSLLRLFVFCLFTYFACCFLLTIGSRCSSFLPTVFPWHWKQKMGGKGEGCLNFLLSNLIFTLLTYSVCIRTSQVL